MQRDAMIMHALRNPQVADKIGLSEEQRETISRKVEKLEDRTLTLKYKMEKASLKQARLMTAKDIDEKALMDVIDELGEYRTQMAKQKIGMLIFMRKTLTPEQAKNMREIMRERMRKNKKEHGEDWRRNAKNSSEKKQKMENKRRKSSETKPEKDSNEKE
jgi:Spy/CpxP family protein refolding chaperone